MATCKQCNHQFTIYTDDKEFYQRIDVPAPTLCPHCRQQRRLAWRNERNLYSRTCDLCGRNIISVYHQDSSYKVYCANCWWSDKWSGLDYGRDFNFNNSFFQQFHELMLKVPRLAIINKESENSEYTNISAQNKNCYMVIESSNNENCLYGYWLQKSRDLADCSFCHNSELCYECDNCYNCYSLKKSRNCHDCNQSSFLLNCSGCSECIGCANLINKKYYIFNQQFTPQDYQKFVQQIDLIKLEKQFNDFILKQPRRFAEINKCENCLGNYLENCQDCWQVFHGQEAEKCRYSAHVWRQAKDCMDVDTAGMNAELIYESINTAISVYNNKFCCRCWTNHDLEYCDNCDNSKNCFGCTGLNHQEYCILNKQYAEADYKNIKEKIIEQMMEAKEYGEFFPAQDSPFPYVDSVANDYFPQAEKVTKIIADKNLPICSACGKNYKFIQQELDFYKKMNLAKPQKCFNCRFKDRMALRNPRKLYSRICAKCQENIPTTYAPDSPEIIYCEDCYNKEFY